MTSDDDLLRSPIFILGAPRSGTAILADILRSHPDLAYVREPRFIWRHGNDDKSDLLRPEDARPEVVAHIRSSFAALVREQGRGRLLEKLPSNSLRIPFVLEVFPDARVLHVMRHGPDAIAAIRRRWLEPAKDLTTSRQRDRVRRHLREASFAQYRHYLREVVREYAPGRLRGVTGVRQWGPRLPGLDGLVRDLDVLEVCALQWRSCVEMAAHHGRQLPADRYLECRVESLDEAVVRALAAICELTDVDPLLRTFEADYDRARVLPRAEALTAAERDQVMAWVGPTMRWLELTDPVG